MPNRELRPYGLWPSPIAPAAMARSLRLHDVQWDSDGRTLVWLEGRSDQGVLVCARDGGVPRDLTDALSVRAQVGYGGGDFTVAHGCVIFAERNGRLYRQPLESGPARLLTPAFGHAAAPTLSPDGRWVLFVHSYERSDALALVDRDGALWPLKLVTGSDFYMQPVWHPDGDHIAWIEWDHPNMPWDGTRLKMARLAGDPPRLESASLVAGDLDTPAFQPAFSPDGRWLSFILGDGEFDRLYLLDLATGQRRVLVEGAVLAEPAWAQGQRTHAWSHDSRRIFYLRNDRGFLSLWVVDVASGRSTAIDAPYTALGQIAASPVDDRVAVIASSSQTPPRVAVWDGERWTGYDVPDFPVTKPPTAPARPDGIGLDALSGTEPFIMMPDGRGWLFVPSGLVDGPLPTHYEPAESPVRNPLYRQQASPVLKYWPRPGNPLAAAGDPRYPYIISTYRLTEHYLAGAMSRWLPWLTELQPELFIEIGPELAREKGIANLDWVRVRTPRGEIRAKALVTSRLRPFRIAGRVVHHVGMPWPWGYMGLVTGDVTNELTSLVADPNVSIHEGKAFMCNVEKA